jgi:hypothetical protein
VGGGCEVNKALIHLILAFLSLCSYLKQKGLFFFIYKITEQKGATGTAWVGVPGERRRKWGKGMGG